MKKITLILPDGYDQIVSVTAIGVEARGYKTITNVMTKAFEVAENYTYTFFSKDGVADVRKEENNEENTNIV